MSSKRGADLLASTLKAASVSRIFTLSGNHIMPVFDAALDAGIEDWCAQMPEGFAARPMRYGNTRT